MELGTLCGSGRHDGGWGKLWAAVLVVSDLFTVFIMLLSFVFLFFLFFGSVFTMYHLAGNYLSKVWAQFYDSPFSLWLCRGLLVEY